MGCMANATLAPPKQQQQEWQLPTGPITYDEEVRLTAALCRKSFWDFVKEFWETVPGAGKMKFNWHLEFFAQELETVAERVFKGLPKLYDLCLNCPPGTSKSTIWSILFPAWCWIRMPSCRIMTASHTDSLALDLANKARSVIKSDKYAEHFPEIVLTESQDTKGYYSNTAGGDRYTCTVAGKSPMGFHAHVAICLPWGTKLATDKGELPIGLIVDEKLVVKVLAYDHAIGLPCWRSIEAYEKNPGDWLTKLEFLGGGHLELTEEHPVWIVGKGYVPARNVTISDAVLRLGDYGLTVQDTVSRVVHKWRKLNTTYNVRVAQDHNYFANGILVHNCDDPLDPKKVQSDAELAIAKDFIENVLPTRKVDKAVSVTCLVMQRLGLRDSTEVMINISKIEGSAKVRHIVLPAELTEDVTPPDLASKYVDGLLDPVRLGRMVLSEFKARGDRFYSTQFLQKPYSKRGGRFDERWFGQRCRCAPYDSKRVRYWDRAATQDGGCYSAGVLMAKAKDGRYYVEHVEKGQWEPNKRNDIIVATALRDRMRYGPLHEPTIVIEAERGSTGFESYQNLARRLAGHKIKEDMPSGSKDVRAEPWGDMLASGNVVIVDGGQSEGVGVADWDVQNYIDEHVAFQPDVTNKKRLGAIKDQVDSSSGGFNWLVKQLGAGQMGIKVLGPRRFTAKGRTHVVVVTEAELAELNIRDHDSLLISIHDLSEFPLELPPHGLDRLIDKVQLQFLDIKPQDYQSNWNQPVEGWGKKPEELVMNREHAKKLWAFLLKKRLVMPDAWVISSPGGKRALSVAWGLCEALGWDKKKVINLGPQPDDNQVLPPGPPNDHVSAVTKGGRHLVVG